MFIANLRTPIFKANKINCSSSYKVKLQLNLPQNAVMIIILNDFKRSETFIERKVSNDKY